MSKYSNMSGKELKIECGVHGLSKSGRKDELIKRLEKDDRQNPCYEQFNEPEKTPYLGYEGPTINETICVGDYIGLAYCDRYANSKTSYVEAEVIQVTAGTNGSGLNGTVILNFNNWPLLVCDKLIRRT